ncbi:MAG: sigma-70 family RNA polymerase sigma factor [Deltaproteobacteria bacterium]|nr:sigma-70 family RNA polymerase sigma factor [Deltaproteobacteria bacterium]
MSSAYGLLCIMPLELANGQAGTLDQVAEGSEVADVARWFDRHGPFLLRVVTRLVGDAAAAEDIVQETFLVAHRRHREVQSYQNIRAWLYRVAANLVRHQRRSLARRLRLEQALISAREEPHGGASQSPLAVVESSRRRQQVRECVARLPHKQREVFVLFELEGVEGTAISQLLGIPENTVWTRLHHARKRFRALWERQDQSEGTP